LPGRRPLFWRQSSASASTASAPQWIAYGRDPSREMFVSWSAGTATGPVVSVPKPLVQWGPDASYGRIEPAFFSGTVPVPSITGEPADRTGHRGAQPAVQRGGRRPELRRRRVRVLLQRRADRRERVQPRPVGSVREFTTSDTAEGGTGSTVDVPDPVANYSAYRHANWSFIAIDVKAPCFFGGETSMLVRAIDPTQNSGGITSTSGPVVMDSVTLVRTSRGIF
jgi:hypothetical protein